MTRDLFGELRELMQSSAAVEPWAYAIDVHRAEFTSEWVREDAWRARVRELILAMSEAEPEVYEREWLPYLSSFPEHWRVPLADHYFGNTRGLYEWDWRLLEVAPCACFGFHATSNAMNGSRFRDPEKFEGFVTYLEDFTHLNFSDHAVMAQGAQNIARNEGMAHVRQLVLDSCHIGDAGFEALARSTTLNELEMLDVSHCGISDEGVMAWCEFAAYQRLYTMKLAGNKITSEGLKMLLEPGCFSSLKVLDMRANSVNEDHLNTLAWWVYRPARVHVVL